MDKMENIMALTMLDDPAFLLLNEKHTLMIKGDKSTWLLVYSKRTNKEGFIPCNIDLDSKKLSKGDRAQFVPSDSIPEFTESKKLQPGLGSVMSSI